MARLGSWIEPFPQGIHVGPADAWVDPSVPKPWVLMHWCMTHQIKARELNLVGYEDEDDSAGVCAIGGKRRFVALERDMSDPSPPDVRTRLRVLAAVVVSYLAGYIPLLLSGWTGWWWAEILLIASLPLAAMAALASLICARSILAHPIMWAVSACVLTIMLSVTVLFAMTGSLVGLASMPVAALAAGVFVLLAKSKVVQGRRERV